MTGKKITLGLLLGWICGLLVLIASMENYLHHRNVAQALLMALLGLMLLPPTWRAVEKKADREVSTGVRIIFAIGLLCAIYYAGKPQVDVQTAEQAGEPSTSAYENSTTAEIPAAIENQEPVTRSGGIGFEDARKLYASILEDDFTMAMDGAKSILKKDAWLEALKLGGAAKAGAVLADFRKNEVAATKKYEGAWLVEGRIQAVDDAIGQAIIHIGPDRYFNFNAKMNDKERAAGYERGQNVKLYCEKIGEIATLVFGQDCIDFTDWKEQFLTGAVEGWDRRDDSSDLAAFGRLFREIRKEIYDLPENTACTKGIAGKSCRAELDKAFGDAAVRMAAEIEQLKRAAQK